VAGTARSTAIVVRFVLVPVVVGAVLGHAAMGPRAVARTGHAIGVNRAVSGQRARQAVAATVDVSLVAVSETITASLGNAGIALARRTAVAVGVLQHDDELFSAPTRRDIGHP